MITAQSLEILPLDALEPYARNSRTHSDAQVAQIAASILEFGFTNPVLIDADGGIIAGHGRVMAARKVGIPEVPCIRLEHLTEAQRRAYVIADNKLALNAGWDFELLADELEALQAESFDVTALGFDDAEIAAILSKAEETELPELKAGDREPVQQMTFTLSDEQAERVKEAIRTAKRLGRQAEDGNANGNALALVCEAFLSRHAHS